MQYSEGKPVVSTVRAIRICLAVSMTTDGLVGNPGPPHANLSSTTRHIYPIQDGSNLRSINVWLISSGYR